MSRVPVVALLLSCTVLLAGCETVGKYGGKALETVGLKKPEPPPPLPEVPESLKPPRRMKLTIAASDALNVDAAGQSLTLVVRVFKLRSPEVFLNAPYEAFGNSAREKEILADELIDSREMVLLPGRRLQIDERWVREATHVGVVGLFRAPAAKRWRHAFELETFQRDPGFVLGAHACGLSVAVGQPIGLNASDMKLIPATCPQGTALSLPNPLSKDPT